jgi:hypothetical protein
LSCVAPLPSSAPRPVSTAPCWATRCFFCAGAASFSPIGCCL